MDIEQKTDHHHTTYSLGWMEMRTTLAKVIWTFDLEPADLNVDWLRDSRMQTLWVKPPLKIRARLARHVDATS